MITTLIKSIGQYVGQEVQLQGWAYNFRSSGKIFFLQLRDGSARVQIVYSKADVSEETWNALESIRLESSVRVFGRVKEDSRAPSGFELDGLSLEVISLAMDEYPIGKKDHGPDFLLDNRHLWLRSDKQWAIQRVRDTIITATYNYFHENDFVKFDTPILTPTSCEGTTELFEMDYFSDVTNNESGYESTNKKSKAYLSQSGQLYLEAGIMSLGRAFDFGPVFRAEKSKTRRHLTEFWMMDAEAAFVEHQGNMQIQEGLICRIVHDVLANCQHELKVLERDTKPLEAIQAPFVHMTHQEAIAKLRTLGSDIGDMDDLGADDETILTQQFDRPIFIEKYPAAVKAFYMKRDPEHPEFVLNNDLLAPEGYGEIIGGSQREDDYETLLERMLEHNLAIEPFQWYLDLRKYGSVPHSGFGYGLERITAWMCGLQHIRETIPFPRLINRLTP
ncbi:asparagine--tRNA ligase [Candidatus Uhrbacteria bacterium RIFCSPHIGHO2_02_FULL_47_44]|uniref:Asparagine--tRNA ligase n=1 Tax=Candidatus Uhrbacteria bacterium RIFCSPLOWO2_02_FULL_48_18 TaxID=1802408 RepID=A0A1F7V852_9BACT|nr:MAG: asparagine--tRNA ligase [Candidatus Uhrbacteria bacterium RIFCSPHIGHO2_01_FULL_47_10]OGL70938.1 MAG: asparagine--tRNA ligase [Candidatus Uhrbacteria bacterium RIFCSPHIGHO2_02_FULL_47_44]OGL80737.1 MAG: asparagine--tRNA ligase [Candidatus Uhrbacteria bacterium RIFCSPLOWO2_01_FULL_47_17]OGL86611.1 MAG: asparagine--tRNA ligase [Candidatus Uhrbacteria bacterium RIFCSPLOWO2_02_FULL_48_18]OGL92892.1 MAG: asparagine--tRNA ligase [Candidatus Uhrbacteria bacterium RIFCSPLOWO2_12_FULL_47_9]